jgi:hypothetical protein
MDYVIKFSEWYCATDEFKINGIDAYWEDFGEKYDRSPEGAEPYGCGNMKFTRIDSTPEVLQKYNITDSEYESICDDLEIGLSSGNCVACA